MALLITSQIFIQRNVAEQKTSGEVINRAGKQRMLSERILSHTYMLEQSDQNYKVSSELLATTLAWYESHYSILNGNLDLGIPAPDETLEAEMNGLNAVVEKVRNLVFDIVNQKQNNYAQVKENIDIFLPRMDLAVAGLALRSEGRVTALNFLNLVSTGLGFLLGMLFIKMYPSDEVRIVD